MRGEDSRTVNTLVTIAAVALMCAACRQEPKGTVIARVGEAELTLERALTHIDTTRGVIGAQLREYVSAWTTTELLYREATRLGIEKSPEFQEQLGDVQRQLTTERYLTSVLTAMSATIDADSMKSYYEAHTKEFLLREHMLKLRIVMCANRELASNFSASVVQTGNWPNVLKKLTGDSSGSQSGYTEIPAQFYSQSTLYPPELWRVALSLSVNEVSFPVRSGERYYVLQLLATAQQGKPAEYEIVEDEVRQRMIIERRRKQYADLLGTLRGKYTVELLLDGTVMSDTLQGGSHE